MKLLVGDPGKPDGWIPPDAIYNAMHDNSCKTTTTGKSCGRNNIYKIDGVEINLFNITGS